MKESSLKKLDEQFRHWITYQRSCVSDKYSEWDDNDDGRCVACHVRRASSSGTALKPLFSCVPLTFTEHGKQHQHGEDACIKMSLEQYAYNHLLKHMTAKEFFDYSAKQYLIEWLELNPSIDIGDFDPR